MPDPSALRPPPPPPPQRGGPWPIGPFDIEPGEAYPERGRSLREWNREHLLAALEGIELGLYDARILEWLCNSEPSTLAAIAGWVARARQAATADLYRVDMSLLAGGGNGLHSPMPCYLVRAMSPRDAIAAAEAKIRERWPDARELEVLRIWRYPATGALALGGADHLMPGEVVLRSEYLPESGRPDSAPDSHSAAALQADSDGR